MTWSTGWTDRLFGIDWYYTRSWCTYNIFTQTLCWSTDIPWFSSVGWPPALTETHLYLGLSVRWLCGDISFESWDLQITRGCHPCGSLEAEVGSIRTHMRTSPRIWPRSRRQGRGSESKTLDHSKQTENWVRYRSPMKKWGLVDSAACECGEPEQTAAHIINSCPLHRPPPKASLFEVGVWPEHGSNRLSWQYDMMKEEDVCLHVVRLYTCLPSPTVPSFWYHPTWHLNHRLLGLPFPFPSFLYSAPLFASHAHTTSTSFRSKISPTFFVPIILSFHILRSFVTLHIRGSIRQCTRASIPLSCTLSPSVRLSDNTPDTLFQFFHPLHCVGDFRIQLIFLPQRRSQMHECLHSLYCLSL